MILVAISAAVSCLALPAGAAMSGRSEPAIPLPPPRPAEFGGQHRNSALSVTGETPASATIAVATLPRALPPATRERMQACGLEWQQIKWSGTAGERTWRDFAMGCLAH
jgi:hypothetical protein